MKPEVGVARSGESGRGGRPDPEARCGNSQSGLLTTGDSHSQS